MFGRAIATIGLAFILTSCGKTEETPVGVMEEVEVDVAKTLNPSMGCLVYNYGQGVYYFKCNEQRFVRALVRFKQTNQNLIVAAISGDGTGNKGKDSGYFVSTELRMLPIKK